MFKEKINEICFTIRYINTTLRHKKITLSYRLISKKLLVHLTLQQYNNNNNIPLNSYLLQPNLKMIII